MLTLVIIPTYNERENIGRILPRVLAAAAVDVLVVDDSSPDGTGALVAKLAADDPRIQLITRPLKQGLGPAYIAGFDYALTHGYDVVVELDGDGSHSPDDIPRLLQVLADDTVGAVGGVIGSRWVAGGAVVNWPKTRELISRGGSWYARTMLGLKVRDVTAGFRAYRTSVLRDIHLDDVESQGYCFQIDLTRRVISAGYGLVEVPIVFHDREFGESKMSGTIVREAMARTTVWGLARIFRR